MGAKIIFFYVCFVFVSLDILGQDNHDYNKMIKITSLTTNGIVLGEAIALGVGMHLLSKGNNDWISTKNDILLGVDFVSSIGLLYITLSRSDFYMDNLTYYLAGVSLLTHTYRTIEYFNLSNNHFCANIPLMVVNNIKLLGLGLIIGNGLYIRYTMKF